MKTSPIKPHPGYYTVQEIRDRFNWAPHMISHTAKRENWRAIKPIHSGVKLQYFAQDVEDFVLARTRTKLLRQLGAKMKLTGNVLFREKDYDMICTECGAFAVWKPVISHKEIDRDHMVSQPWICLNGHTGKTCFLYWLPSPRPPEVLPGIVAFFRSYVFKK